MLDAARIRALWARLDQGRPVFLVRKDGEFLCEGPVERLDLGVPGRPDADDDTESVVRVFLSRREVEEYRGIWCELLGVGPKNKQITVVTAVLPDIWKHLRSIVGNSYADYQVPPRIEVCTLPLGSFPITIDTLFSEWEEMN